MTLLHNWQKIWEFDENNLWLSYLEKTEKGKGRKRHLLMEKRIPWKIDETQQLHNLTYFVDGFLIVHSD